MHVTTKSGLRRHRGYDFKPHDVDCLRGLPQIPDDVHSLFQKFGEDEGARLMTENQDRAVQDAIEAACWVLRQDGREPVGAPPRQEDWEVPEVADIFTAPISD